MTRTRHFGNKAVLLALLLLCSGRGLALAAQDCSFGNDDMDDIQRIRSCMAGSSPDEWSSRNGKTMLHRAAQYTSNPTVVSVILNAGFDPNARSDEGSTPLHYSAFYNANPVVSGVVMSILLDAGADPNIRDNRGRVPLLLAAQLAFNGEGYVRVSILLDAGADPNIRANDGRIPLQWGNGEPGLLRMLLDAGADPDLRNGRGWSVLHNSLLVGGGARESVPILLDAGADPHARTHDGEDWTALHIAAAAGSSGIFALLNAGADPMAKSADGRTPLHSAVYYNGSRGMVSALLDAGGGAELTQLHVAVLAGDSAAVTTALEQGADPNVTDSYGWTALHFAAVTEQWQVFGQAIPDLLAGGADPDPRDVNGKTPLDFVYQYGGRASSMMALLDAEATLGAGVGGDGIKSIEGDSVISPVDAALLDAGDTFRDCAGCPEMVVVPVGSFMMGSSEGEERRYDNEGPRHRVTIRARFAVGVHEVSFAEWVACALGGGCADRRPADQGWGGGSRPVINVSWEDAQQYVRWLSGETGEEYRLLSEAEWEYVARAGTQTVWYWGDDESEQCRYANGDDDDAPCADGHENTAPVGSFQPNAFGLYDVLGNVWEWTEDCWNETYSGAPGDGSARRSGDCSSRVLRGGSWIVKPRFLRSADRSGNPAGNRDNIIGFRVARTIK